MNLEPSNLPPTGGHVYNRRIIALAPCHGLEIRSLSLPARSFPLSLVGGRSVLGVARTMQPSAILVDSLVTHRLWPGPLREAAPPLIGLVHQPPGGLDHGWPRRRLQELLDLHVYRRLDGFIATSPLLADSLVARGIPRERITVVEPGTGRRREGERETRREGERERRSDGETGGTGDAGKERRSDGETGGRSRGELRRGRGCAVLCVGNWLERKGVHLLVEAVSRLRPDCVTLHLVGDVRANSGYGRRLAELIGRPELAERVVVHGVLSECELERLYAAADVFALPSLGEPYGMVYAEALAAGLPVVGFRSGNLPYLVRDAVEGLLAAPRDVDGLAMALRRLAEDEPLRLRLAGAARQAGARLPTWEQTAERFCTAVRRVARA